MNTKNNLANSLASAKQNAAEIAAEARRIGMAKARDLACGVDGGLRSHPWHCLAGATVVGIIIGYLAGRARN